MVEISDIYGVCNFGCFASFAASHNTLDGLVHSGELSKDNPMVLVSSYKGNELQREYTATLSNGKWRTIRAKKAANKCHATSQPIKKVRSVHSRITRNSHIKVFKDAFPTWLNKTYQPL